MRHIFYTLLCAVFVGAETAAALTDAWTVDVRQHGAVQRTYKQGETHDLTVTLRDGLKPLDLTGATAHFYWYTNATDNLWWTNAAAVSPSGLVTASWTPAMDTGAASYNWWIGIWQAGATSPLWRVTGTIRMLPSPGFEPNALPVPVRTLDLAAVIVTNAPWVTAADWASGSNALASALQPLGPRIASMESRTNTWDYASTLPDLWSRFGAHVDDILTNPHSVRADQIGAATTQQLAAAVAPLASTQQLAAAVVAIQIPVQSVNAKTGAVVLAAADVGALASSGDAYVTLSDGGTTFSVSTSFGERIALDSVDQAIHIFRDGTVELYDYESDRGFREMSLFDVPTYADLSSRVAANGGIATNLTTRGWLALPQTQATNLTMRLVSSNDVIMAIGVLE